MSKASDDLRASAAKARRLASGVGDQTTIDVLGDYARECDDQACAMDEADAAEVEDIAKGDDVL